MEKIENKVIMVKEEDFILFDTIHISSTISKIKDSYFPNNKKFKIKINYFKKISKEKTYVELQINKKLFDLTFYFGYLQINSKKESRKNFSSLLLDEIFINFVPIVEFKFYSDNMNFTSPYTLKYLTKNLNHSLRLRSLEINNYVFDSKNTDVEFLVKLNKINIDIISLTFSIDKLCSDVLYEYLNFLLSKKTKKISLTFLFKYLDVESFIKNPQNSKNTFSLLGEFNLNLIKYYPDKSILITENDKSKISLITKSVMETYWPSFIEVNFSEIIRAQINQQIKYFFRKLNIKYSKENFLNLNIFKDILFSKHLRNKKNNISNIFTLCSKFCLKDDNYFIFSSKSFGLKLSNIHNIDLKKWQFYFVQEYDSQSIRKIPTEDIKRSLYRQSDSDSFNQFRLEKYNFKNNDLNTVSRILTQIEGFTKVYNKNGEKYYIGGRMKAYENNKEQMVLLNCILTFNNDYSNLQLRVYKDTVLIPHFNASSQIFRENHIMINGGLTVKNYQEVFSKTPIFIVDLINYYIFKIIPEGIVYPGFIFNHKTTIINENKFLISEGYTLANDQNTMNFWPNSKQSKVSKNISQYEFDFTKGKWRLSVNDLKI
jgi:hypothetical protein